MRSALASILCPLLLSGIIAACAGADEQAFKQYTSAVAALAAEHDTLEAAQTRIEATHAKNALSFEAQSIAALSPMLTRRHDSLMKLHGALVDAHEELFKQHALLLQSAMQAATRFKAKQLSASDLLGGMNKILAATKELRADNAEMLATHDTLNAAHKAVMSDVQAFKKGQ